MGARLMVTPAPHRLVVAAAAVVPPCY
eukprot:SAG25_NODE_15231_length_145_cov_39.478261_1_plen_26_part_01